MRNHSECTSVSTFHIIYVVAAALRIFYLHTLHIHRLHALYTEYIHVFVKKKWQKIKCKSSSLFTQHHKPIFNSDRNINIVNPHVSQFFQLFVVFSTTLEIFSSQIFRMKKKRYLKMKFKFELWGKLHYFCTFCWKAKPWIYFAFYFTSNMKRSCNLNSGKLSGWIEGNCIFSHLRRCFEYFYVFLMKRRIWKWSQKQVEFQKPPHIVSLSSQTILSCL